MGPFGANKDRFFKSWLDPKEGPDPGQYTKPLVRVEKSQKNKYDLAMEGRSQASTRALTAAEKERTKMNSVFCSNTERFKHTPDTSLEVKGFDPSKTSTVFKSQGNVLTAKDIVQYEFKDTRTQWTQKARANDYEIFSGKPIGFDKNSPRFNFD